MALKEANKEAKEKQYLKKYREIKAEYQTDTRKYMHALEEEVARLTKLKEKIKPKQMHIKSVQMHTRKPLIFLMKK